MQWDLLMIQRTLYNQSSPQELTQRENIFHTRCKVLENTCSLIVDSGSCCNCCSTRLVESWHQLSCPIHNLTNFNELIMMRT